MTTILSVPMDSKAKECEAFAEKLLQYTGGAMNLFAIYLGDRLGFYEVLAEDGPLSAPELARRTGTHERYTREWLEQQAVAGIVNIEPEDTGSGRHFYLPPGHAEVLAERDSVNYMAPLAQLFAGAVKPLPAILEAYRSGGGVHYSEYGPDAIEGQARINRAMFLKLIAGEWFPAIPDVDARLKAEPAARVADVGCGAGWSSIGIALGYPRVFVDGLDTDTSAISLARVHASSAGVSDRVSFQARDAADPGLAGRYDLVTAFECIHDMSRPVEVLRAMRRLVNSTGTVIIADERVQDSFSADGTGMDWMMYGWSILHCLPAGMADKPSSGTGTVMRLDKLRDYARSAGFRDVEVLPIDNLFLRFYRLR